MCVYGCVYVRLCVCIYDCVYISHIVIPIV